MKLPRLLRPWREPIIRGPEREPRLLPLAASPPVELEPLLLTDFVEPERQAPAAR